MAALTIKNEEAVNLVRELGVRKAQGLTAAGTGAVRGKRERVKAIQSKVGLAARRLALGTNDPNTWPEPNLATRHGDLLHDGHGLPK